MGTAERCLPHLFSSLFYTACLAQAGAPLVCLCYQPASSGTKEEYLIASQRNDSSAMQWFSLKSYSCIKNSAGTFWRDIRSQHCPSHDSLTNTTALTAITRSHLHLMKLRLATNHVSHICFCTLFSRGMLRFNPGPCSCDRGKPW